MDSIVGVRVCPYCPSHPMFAPGNLSCGVCGTKRPARSAYVQWVGGTDDQQQREQDAFDAVLHSDRISGWFQPTISVDGSTRRIQSVEVHTAREDREAVERLGRDEVAAVYLMLGLTVE